MDFRELNYVQAIARYQTISAAAEHLYLSQPSLSLFLQKLENKLGVTLFERINKRMYPTHAGKRYLEYAENILLNAECMKKELSFIARNQSGCLSVGSTPTRTRYVMPELLTAFHQQYPDFLIRVEEGTSEELRRMLDEHVIDFAFLTVPERDKQHGFFHLTWEEIVLCTPASQNYRRFCVPRENFLYPWIDLQLLKDDLFLLVPETWRAGRAARRCFEQIGLTPRSISFSIVETAVAASGCGLGLSFCPDIMIRRGQFMHTPDYFSVGNNPSHMEFILMYRPDFPLTSPLRDFIRMSQEILALPTES